MTLSPQNVDFDALWDKLKQGVGSLLTLSGNVKGMPLYEIVYKLCTARPVQFDSRLYYTFKTYLKEHVERLYESMVERQELLNEYRKSWTEFEIGCRYCSGFVFSYLNNQWITNQIKNSKEKLSSLSGTAKKDVRQIYELALVTWKQNLFDKLKDRLCREILTLIEKERNGEQIEISVVGGVINSYIKLGSIKPEKYLKVYQQDFEIHYLKATEEFYTVESNNMSSSGISEYLKLVQRRLNEEESRSRKYLDSSSFNLVMETCHKVLLISVKDIFQTECEVMLRQDLRDDLRRMYLLQKRLDKGIDLMLDALYKHIVSTGTDAITAVLESGFNQQLQKSQTKSLSKDEEEEPNEFQISKVYVEALLKIHHQFVDLVNVAFSNDSNFQLTLDRACRKVVNENAIAAKDSSRSPELLAYYTDVLLRKSTKHIDENELEEKLKQVIVIFKYLSDKDVFQKFYSKYLTKRLIHSNSVSDEAEKVMINGLREACGYEYTVKISRMFTDIGTSSEINDKFKGYLTNNNINIGVDFNILVLTSGAWPIFAPRGNWVLPAELESTTSVFTKFYFSLHNGRQLNWLHSLSRADIKMMYTSKKYEFQATNYQVGILLLFNNYHQLNERDLLNSTGMENSELRRTMKSLLETKIVLRKEEANQIYFILNPNFQSKRMKFKITAALQQETGVQNSDTRKSVQEDRNLYLQAAIVRIMKMRKQIRHVELVKEVISQSKARFQPHIQMIKRCIEHLIEKEYIERIESDLYSYVA